MESKEASDLRSAISVIDTLFVRYGEEESYQCRLARLLATWRRNKAVPAVTEVDVFCLDEDWSLLRLVVKQRYSA